MILAVALACMVLAAPAVGQQPIRSNSRRQGSAHNRWAAREIERRLRQRLPGSEGLQLAYQAGALRVVNNLQIENPDGSDYDIPDYGENQWTPGGEWDDGCGIDSPYDYDYDYSYDYPYGYEE